MEFRVLGPLEVRADDQPLPLAGARQRALLAVLLIEANRVVPVHRLVDAVWGEAPPATAASQVQAQISGLRRALADGDPDREVIVTRPPGYLVRVEADALDVDVFEQRAAEAGDALAQGDSERAADGFAAALSLWRGSAFADVTGLVAETEAARLAERHLAVLEQRIEADLALGRHAALVGELGALVAEHPLRERLRAQLMLALYRCGRQAEALDTFQQARQVLVDELGIDPGGALQRMQQAILAADPDLEISAAPPPAFPSRRASTRVVAPAQVPPDIGDFTGRSKQAARVCDLLAPDPDNEHPPRPLVISAIAGRAGVGKTTLAVHAAHRVRQHFPDGQLHVDLRGAEAQPLDPGEVLERFLRALGVDPMTIPETVEERSRLYRSRLADRRVLVLLDNAASETQVRPLLPGVAGCAVLVTSRARLAALEGARPVEVDTLPPEQAVELLSRVADPQRVAAEPDAARKVARLCGYLPLAVRIAGARLAARPRWRLSRLAAALADERRLLDELRAGDLEVRASLALSYHGLDPTAQRAFRRLGLLDSPEFPAWLAAALLDVGLPEAERVLDRLVDAQLLDVAGQDVVGQDRHRLHDLVRVYARERAVAEDSPAQSDAAIERMLGGWLGLAEQAAESLVVESGWEPKGNAPRWRVDRDATETLLAEPCAWFDVEWAFLLMALERAAAADLSELAWELASSLLPFLEVRGRFDDTRRLLELALAVTRRTGNRRGEAVMLHELGVLDVVQGDAGVALDCLEQAVSRYSEVGDRRGEAHTRVNLGVLHQRNGRPQEALRCLEQALTIRRGLGDRRMSPKSICRYARGRGGRRELLRPDEVYPAIAAARTVTGKTVVLCPNSGQGENLLAATDDPDTTARDLDPPDARARITAAIERGAITFPPLESDTWPAGRPLVEWIAAMLPAAGAGYQRPEFDEAALAEQFFDSRFGQKFDDDDHRLLLDSVLWFGTDYGPGDPLRWSLTAVEILLVDWIPRKIVGDVGHLSRAPELLRAFIRFSRMRLCPRPWATSCTFTALIRRSIAARTNYPTSRVANCSASTDPASRNKATAWRQTPCARSYCPALV